jgi:hypothetical protein
VASNLPQKIIDQINKAGLPMRGQHPFVPALAKNRKGESIIRKAAIQHGPKIGKVGYVDDQGRIWLRDRAHANVPDHWDVQIGGGQSYFRVDDLGDEIL